MVKAVVATGTGGTEVLQVVERESRELGAGEVRVEVKFVGVNFWDVMQRKGIVPIGDQSIPGVEGVGVITEAGPGVSSERVGERVVWSKVNSSYASEVIGLEGSFVPIPEALGDEDAARVLMQGVTAQYLAESTWPLDKGQIAVVQAAAGGVGSLLTQFLKARGARVIGVVSREEKVEAAKSAGADDVVVMSDSFVDDVKELAPEGVDVVFDANGGAESLLGVEVLRTRGALVLYGAANGPTPEFDLGRLGGGSLYVTRTAGRDYARTPEEWRERADDVLARAAAGSLKAIAGGVWPLEEAAEVHAFIESRQSTGKLLLKV